MEPRIRYRVGGRFASQEQAEAAGVGPEFYDPSSRRTVEYTPPIIGDFGPVEQEEEQRIFWEVVEQERVILWQDFTADAPSSLGDFSPPGGVTRWRAFFNPDASAEYPKGWASTSWMDMDSWPPSVGMVKGHPESSFNHIRFDKG